MTVLVFEQRLGELPTSIGSVLKQHVEAIPSELESHYTPTAVIVDQHQASWL
jgi:hypothetical protein